jgi:hypothetical protein
VRSLQAMELFDGLFDDETLLRSPEARPLAQVVAKHRELRAAYRSQLAALVVPDTQLTAVSRQLPAGVDLPVSVITTGGAGGLLALVGRDLPGIDIVSVEPALRDLDDLVGSAARVISAAAELGSDVDIFVGLPYAPGWEAAVEPIEAAGLYGKIGAAGPSATAEQLSILVEADLPFKITGHMEWDWLTMLSAHRLAAAADQRPRRTWRAGRARRPLPAGRLELAPAPSNDKTTRAGERERCPSKGNLRGNATSG